MITVSKTVELSQWNKFVEESNNGTIFHSLTFQKYHKKGKFKFLNLVFKKNGKIIALLPGAVKNGVYSSPSGASYGSFVVRDIEFTEYEEIIDSFLKYCKKMRIKKIKLIPPPIFYQKKQNEIERFVLEYKGFKPFIHLISSAVNVGQFKNKEDLFSSFTDMHKRAIKKSIKEEIVVKRETKFGVFYDILLENKKKFNTVPTHTLEEIVKLKKLFPSSIVLFMAYTKSKQPLAGILAFKCNNMCILAFYICHYYAFQQYRGVNRLFYEVAEYCRQNSISWLDLGVSMDTSSKNPMEPSRNLINFKEGIGTRGFLRTTYIYTF